MEEKKDEFRRSFWSIPGFRNIAKFIFRRRDYSQSSSSIFLNKRKGFTLIEILVVIGLLAIISSVFILIINPEAQLARARDGHRKSDLRQIQAGLELYRADQGSYPVAPVSNVAANCPSSSPTSLVELASDGTCTNPPAVYVQTVPKDPKTGRNYYYCDDTTSPCSAPTGGYSLFACIENVKDTDPNIVSVGPASMSCSSSPPKYYKVINP